MQIHRDIEQGSEEWFKLRLGVVTASRFKDVLAKGRGLTRNSYMSELATEMLTNRHQEGYSNDYMDWGIDTEPQAIANYQFATGYKIERVAFISHDTISAGCSPDILVNDDGLAEIKCPKTETQLKYYSKGVFPIKYKAQVQGQLWISERQWCDFVSFDPRIEDEASYFCVRVHRDESYIAELEREVIRFLKDLDEMVDIFFP